MNRPRLTILCVSKAEDFAAPFLHQFVELGLRLEAEVVFAADGQDAFHRLNGLPNARIVPVTSRGFLESVLEDAVAECHGEYVLRMDDDESVPPPMAEWLRKCEYLASDHWKFPRAHVWERTDVCIINPPLWPDHQTRLSTLAKSGGRPTVHCGSPFGGGTLAPVLFEHHKFVVKTREQREQIAAKYDRVCRGFGTGGMMPFNVPEEVWPDEKQRELRFLAEMDSIAEQEAVAAQAVA